MLRHLSDLPPAETEALAALARSEGYRFLDRLLAEWQAGHNRFDAPGDRLLGTFDGPRLIAIGGLHRDPYAEDARTGRLRRLYVAPDQRRTGIAATLVMELLAGARGRLDVVRLRVPDLRAARFYEALGFSPVAAPDTTHRLRLG